MSQQQQQQQQQPMEQPTAPTLQLIPPTWEEQLLILIAGLQQVATLLQQNRGARVEVVKLPLFSGKIEEVSMFINVACLYLSMKMTGESEATKMV